MARAERPEVSLEALDDAQLIERIRTGRAGGFEELDRRYRPRLIRLVAGMTRCRDDAEELAQRALIRAYERLATFDATRPLGPWLFTIARRLAIDEHRARQRGATQTPGAIPGALSASGSACDQPDPAPGPAARLVEQEVRRDIWDVAVRVLDADQWTAVTLHYQEGLNAGDIAAVLGRSRVHVRVLLYRARKALTPYLTHHAPQRTAAEPAPTASRPAPATPPAGAIHVTRNPATEPL